MDNNTQVVSEQKLPTIGPCFPHDHSFSTTLHGLMKPGKDLSDFSFACLDCTGSPNPSYAGGKNGLFEMPEPPRWREWNLVLWKGKVSLQAC